MACPFGDDFPGWQIIVEAFYNPVAGRTYGQLNYGSQVYGDLAGNTARWVDITTPSFDITITIGSAAPTAPVPVNELILEAHDDAGAWWDYATPARYNLPYVWTPIRVGLIDPTAVYHPLFRGRVEDITDQHTKPPRVVVVTGYGNVSTLVTSRAGWLRAAETAPARIAALMAVAPTVPYRIDLVDRPALLADAQASTINVRDELDRTAASAGWLMYEDTAGTVHFGLWPLTSTGARIDVTDCVEADNAAELLAGDITFVANTAALLNRAEATNTAGAIASSTDPWSIQTYDEHSQAFGFPYTGLAFATLADAQAVTNRAVNRWSRIINHVDAVAVDTLADRRWLPVLADLSLGRPLRVDRRGVSPYVLDTVITGWTHHLRRNRCETAIRTSTVTPTV